MEFGRSMHTGRPSKVTVKLVLNGTWT